MNPEAIIECVPNFSEGTDLAKVEKIVAATQVEGVGREAAASGHNVTARMSLLRAALW